jgi:hypothetical protein
MNSRFVVATLAASLAAAGCGGAAGEGVETGAEPEAEVTTGPVEPYVPPGLTECTNDQAGYALSYPSDWHTNENGAAPACTYFSPEPVQVPDATESYRVPVTVSRELVPLDALASGDPSREILSHKQAKIAGSRAFRLEVRSTGVGLLPPSIRYYQVAVAVDGETIVLSTHAVEGLDYGRNKQVVDVIAENLQLTG